MHHNLPSPSKQLSLMREQQKVARDQEVRIIRQKEDEHNKSVRTHMEWCDLAITIAMRNGMNHCRFDIKQQLYSFDFYDAERTLHAVVDAINSKEPYSVERIPNTLTLLVSWPIDDSLRGAAEQLLRINPDMTSLPYPDPLNQHIDQARHGVAQSCIDLLSTCNKFAESERIKSGR